MKRTKPKQLTLQQKLTLLKDTLTLVQLKRYHYPDSDAREYCAGCGRSPYNVPAHDGDCLVVFIADVLKRV